MEISAEDVFSKSELFALASIVQVGNATYKDLLENQRPMLGHRYLTDVRGRLRTKLVQIQCEIESHESIFPFQFSEETFAFGHIIPQLKTENVILHIARTPSPTKLPSISKYKIDLSNNNSSLFRQNVLDFTRSKVTSLDPLYGILAFGGQNKEFAIIQFPEPGYKGIADSLIIPQMSILEKQENAETFERKKLRLKNEFLAREVEATIV